MKCFTVVSFCLIRIVCKCLQALISNMINMSNQKEQNSLLFDRLVQYHPAATGSHSPVRRLVTGTWEHQVSYGWSKFVEHVWTVACLCFQTCLLSILFCWPQLSIPLRSVNTCSNAQQVESPLFLCLADRLILAACCQIFGWVSKIHEFEEGDPKADLI